MKRPVAHAVKNRKTFNVEQGFFTKLMQRKNGIFMLKFHKKLKCDMNFCAKNQFLLSKNWENV